VSSIRDLGQNQFPAVVVELPNQRRVGFESVGRGETVLAEKYVFVTWKPL